MLKPIRQDTTWSFGLLLLLASLLVFGAPSFFHFEDSEGGFFIFNYLIAIVYFVVLLGSGRLKRDRNGLAPLFVFLLLALISCYTLNRTFQLFQSSVTWWCVVLVVSGVNYLTLPFYHQFPRPLRYMVCGITGISFIAFLYLALYLMPAYIVSAIAVPALGISLHTYVPLLFVIYTLVFLRRAAISDKRTIIAFVLGMGVAVAFTAQFAFRWGATVNRVDKVIDRASEEKNLPAWVSVAQQIRPSSFDEGFLKAGLVYEESGPWNIFSFDMHHQFDETKRHDPLILLATLFYGQSQLQDNDRIKILECLYDSRHQAQERLWRDDELRTTLVKTEVELWPQQHLSYTEENVTVTNSSLRTVWNGNQEALYSFHLPEGAVVSSLSLWIHGREEKGILSSRHKADSAYTTIVGHESRDPSVVHWQEGNTVVVRVFPVLPQESRKFKLGITAPLEKNDGKLFYHSIYFDGPSASGADASVEIRSMQTPIHLELPPSLHLQGAYQPDWSLHFDDPGIAGYTFSFNGKRYTTETYVPEFEPATITQVYLDINKSWTREEFDTVLASIAGKQAYAWIPETGLAAITAANKTQVFDACSGQQFSLFPFQVVKDKETSLLVSKSPPSSPALSDLNDSPFSEALRQYLSSPGKLRLFSLNDELSPYLKTLKECGAFRFEKGDLTILTKRLRENRFIRDAVQPGLALIDPAGLLIRSSDTEKNAPAGPAPDHLLRLFAYRQIMQQMNGTLPGDYRYDDPVEADTLVQTAREANIVSPVSSLVVLENEEDYKRFDITQSINGLKDASLHSKGAVPEPGEWALLIVVIVVFVFISRRKDKSISL